MTSFEKKALDTWPKNKPKAWYRFIDNVFSIIKQSDVKDFLDHLNTQHPSIKFTLEMEKDKKLPFMDVMVQRIGNQDRGLQISKMWLDLVTPAGESSAKKSHL